MLRFKCDWKATKFKRGNSVHPEWQIIALPVFVVHLGQHDVMAGT
jgi:hypothetical protein